MFEKVNPSHPDKVADRIAGAIVDLCYTKSHDPKVACEVLIGHGECNIQVETSEQISAEDIEAIVERIAGEGIETRALIVPQDIHLAANQQHGVRCGDNGIFRGVPPTHEQKLLTAIAASIYEQHPSDGKYIINSHHPRIRLSDMPEYDTIIQKQKRGRAIMDELDKIDESLRNSEKPIGNAFVKHRDDLVKEYEKIHDYIKKKAKKAEELAESQWENDITICQSHLADDEQSGIVDLIRNGYQLDGDLTINPLGEWTGGPNTDSGATNRKLGSDMGEGVTGGGLHGKDLSKADVSVNIWCYLESIRTGHEVTACCSIGDESVGGVPYADIVEQARLYIHTLGGFEKFAEWGLVRPLAQVKSEE